MIMRTKVRDWKRIRITLLIALHTSLVLLPSSCNRYKGRQELAIRIANLENEVEVDRRISELQRKIRWVNEEASTTIKAVQDKGTFWRLLALKYMDYKMWLEALNAFDEALAIYPEHAALIYNRALCAAQMYRLAVNQQSRSEYLNEAVNGYRSSIAVNGRYTAAYYALAVLLIFELDENGEAADLLERYLQIERSDIASRFLLARAYLALDRVNEARKLYEYISRNASNAEDKDKAEELLGQVEGVTYAP